MKVTNKTMYQGSVGTFCTSGKICGNTTSIDASCNAFSQEIHFAYRLAKITNRGSMLVKWPMLTCWCDYLLTGQTGSVQKVRWGIGFCRCSRCEIFRSYLPQVSWSPANPDYCSPDPSTIIHIGLTSVRYVCNRRCTRTKWLIPIKRSPSARDTFCTLIFPSWNPRCSTIERLPRHGVTWMDSWRPQSILFALRQKFKPQ